MRRSVAAAALGVLIGVLIGVLLCYGAAVAQVGTTMYVTALGFGGHIEVTDLRTGHVERCAQADGIMGRWEVHTEPGHEYRIDVVRF